MNAATDDDAIRLARFLCLRTSPKTVWAFVEVTLASGECGVGEASLSGQEEALAEAAQALLPGWLAARRSADFDLAALPLPAAAIRSAFDLAAHDASARRAGISLAARLGAAGSGPIPLYANINRRTAERSPEGFFASAGHALRRGFDAVKIAPFDEVSPAICVTGDGERAMQAGLARIAATRRAIGPEARLMVDCHWRFDAATARRLVEAVAEFDLHWLECPVAETTESIPLLAELRGRLNARGTRLAGLEQGVGAAPFLAFAEGGAYDVMMPDIKYIGGAEEMRRTAEGLAGLGVEVSPHNPTGPICHAASLALGASLAGFTMLEMQLDETPLFWTLAEPALPEPVGGTSALPTGPGLGVRLDETVAAPLTTLDLRLSARH